MGDLPERFGRPNTIWKRYDRWCAAGVWERVGRALGEADLAGEHDEVQLDATSVKAHPTASTGRRRRGEKNTTPTRGGLTSKPHAAVNDRGQLLRLILTPGQRGDAPQAPALLEGLHVHHVLADAAYDSNAIRRLIRQMKARACIKPNPTRKRRKRYDRQRYKHRNVIERFFRRIKQCRRIATRYEKKVANFASFIWLAAGITTPNECP
ncbi:IS5 family transposase [Phycisphaerales bacterium AB-hyl4]|uniref:IS5 family transposase n=1 Tax=Natronomicrosphaera hydrolytica TaxID=3242702 RepID=A0ABV4U5M5_9BACT